MIINFIMLVFMIIEISSWKKRHTQERASDFYLEIASKVGELRFLILELRSPAFIHNKIEFIENNKIPIIQKIKLLAYDILTRLETYESSTKSKDRLITFYEKNIYESVIHDIKIEETRFVMRTQSQQDFDSEILLPNPPSWKKDSSFEEPQDDFSVKVTEAFKSFRKKLSKKILH